MWSCSLPGPWTWESLAGEDPPCDHPTPSLSAEDLSTPPYAKQTRGSFETRVFGAHIRSTVCYGLPLSTREVIRRGKPTVAMKGSPALCGLLLYNLHTVDPHVTKSAAPQASAPNSGNSKNCCCVMVSSHPPGAKRPQAIWFSLTVF